MHADPFLVCVSEVRDTRMCVCVHVYVCKILLYIERTNRAERPRLHADPFLVLYQRSVTLVGVCVFVCMFMLCVQNTTLYRGQRGHSGLGFMRIHSWFVYQRSVTLVCVCLYACLCV